MALNKISFAYLTLPQPGMVANPAHYTPQISIKNADTSMAYLAIVTVGMVFDASLPFAIEADIQFDGVSVVDNAGEVNDRMTVPFFKEVEQGQIATLAYLEIRDVRLKSSGMYKICCRISESLEKLRAKEFADTLDSYFHVTVSNDAEEK